MASIDLPVYDPAPPPPLPSSLVVRFGYLKLLGELAYNGDVRPSCGTKVVLRTRRGTEIGQVLSTTCMNTGCPTAVAPDKLADYIARSGGEDFPFTTEGKVLRIATAEDLSQQSHIDRGRQEYLSTGKAIVAELALPMRLVDVELLLGGEMATFYFTSEHRVDFRQLVRQLAQTFHTRIQMHQVGARDEARVVADYETCGQHCCCKQFLKVLRPVNMSSAKMQKATLDPSKISGRCGRLKCCLRYEEQTYDELRRSLPRNGTRVRTRDGTGAVIETMILTQLVKVRLDDEDRVIAVANEELLDRDLPPLSEPRPPRRPPQREEEPPEQERAPRRAPSPAPQAASPPDADAERSQESASPADNAASPPSGGRGMGMLGRRRRGRRGPGPNEGV